MAHSLGLSCLLSCSSCSDVAPTGSSLFSALSGVLFSPVPVLLSFERRDLERRLGRQRLDCVSEGLFATGSSLSSSLAFLGVSTMYTSYEEVAVQRPVNGESWPCSLSASSSIPSMSSEP